MHRRLDTLERAQASQRPPRPVRSGRSVWARAWRQRWMYVFIVPGLLYFVVFRYIPLAGNVVAFQQYSPFLGFAESPWVGLSNFTAMFSDPEVIRALQNTLWFSLLQIVFAFPAPIALALLLNSLLSDRIKRIVQSVVYLPHFIGWVIVVSLWQEIFGGAGVLNRMLEPLGVGPLNLMADPDTFAGLITAQVIWKEVGWGTIIFFAAITMISPQLYESAAVDGAGPWRRLWHVTLPGISSVIVLLLILRLGTVLTVGFEQLLLQQPAVGADAAQVVDTFTYYRGVLGGDWGLAAAVGLVKGVIGTVLVIGANRLAKRMGGQGVF
ncbi:ABC transporter permease [Jiangella endophytica]|uniref:ABC transporter permease n=1 Tax=Jiangella endophytica TaxID=1623398 RepID=UPI0018E503BA|nr:ABC transporter permease subunit [Jiangella endophytica]